MAVTVLGGSLWPLVLSLTGAGEYPFLFNVVFRRLGGVVSCGAIIVAAWRRLAFNWGVWRLLGRWMLRWGVLLIIVGQLDFALIALSLRFIDISVAAVIGEMGTLVIILTFAVALSERYGRLTGGGPCALLCFVGAALVGGSQRGFAPDSKAAPIAAGCAIALCGAIADGLGAYAPRWAARAARAARSERHDLRDGAFLLEIFCLVVIFGVAAVAIIPVSAVAGIAAGERVGADMALILIAGGALPHTGVGLGWRGANLCRLILVSTRLSILSQRWDWDGCFRRGAWAWSG